MTLMIVRSPDLSFAVKVESHGQQKTVQKNPHSWEAVISSHFWSQTGEDVRERYRLLSNLTNKFSSLILTIYFGRVPIGSLSTKKFLTSCTLHTSSAQFIQHLSIKQMMKMLINRVLLKNPSSLMPLYHSCHRLCRAHQPRRCLKGPPPFCSPLLEPMELVPGSGGHSRPLRTLSQKWPRPDTRSSQRSRGI